MRRKEAEKLIGQRVEAYTVNWGAYIGILEEITDSRPFRAKVRITEVLKVPEFKPVLREGRVITVGAIHLKKCEKPAKTYQESLKEALENQAPHVIDTLKKALEIYENPDKYYRQSLIWAGEMLATYSRIAENFIKIAQAHKIQTKYEKELRKLLEKAKNVSR